MIDSENVGSTWIDLLQSDEKIDFYIFVTENAKSLNFSLLKQLTENPRHKINIIDCEPGKNSLDFYLSSFVGYLIGKGKHLSYTVVSQDTGYDHVIEYWQREGYDVKRINTKNDTEKKKARRNQPKAEKPAPAVKSAPAKPVPSKPAVNSETRVIVKKQPEEMKPKTEEVKKQAEETRKQQPQQARKQAEEVKKQPEQAKKQEPEEVKTVQAEVKEEAEKPKAKRKRTRTSAKKQNDVARQMLKELLKEYSEEDKEDVCGYLDKVPAEKRSDKNYIYRGLVRKFKSEKGLAIYSLIKKELDRYYNPATENKQ